MPTSSIPGCEPINWPLRDPLELLPEAMHHLNVTADADALLAWPRLSEVRSLDFSDTCLRVTSERMKVTSAFVQELVARGPAKLNWISFGGLRSVDRVAVDALCQAVQRGRMHLRWLDLRGTSYDATPYLEWIDNAHAYWRRPGESRVLERQFGLQDWMTLCQPHEQEARVFIPLDMYPPPR